METPDRKVNVGMFTGALAAIAAWAAAEFAGITVPAEIGIAASTVLSFIVQYMVPNK